tara:strand:+ start:700 stop:1326 length:627 start_codon:yes stop_codon:yes gene_type:complete
MSDSESLSDDPNEIMSEPEEVIEKPKKGRGRPRKAVKVVAPDSDSDIEEEEEKPIKAKKIKLVPVVKAERKKREWSDEQRSAFAERMKKARDAKKAAGTDTTTKKIQELDPDTAELIKEGKKVRKAKLKASIKKQAIKILKQEAAENIVSDSDSSDSEPEMKAVKKYITKRKAKKKTKAVKAPPKQEKENVVVNQQQAEQQSTTYQFL